MEKSLNDHGKVRMVVENNFAYLSFIDFRNIKGVNECQRDRREFGKNNAT